MVGWGVQEKWLQKCEWEVRGLLPHVLALRHHGHLRRLKENCLRTVASGLILVMKGEDIENPERFGAMYGRLKMCKSLLITVLKCQGIW